MAKIDSAFEYYVANYASNSVSRYDSHKKSDLRKIYNRIVKTNKESPLYKISDADSAKRFAIDIKEGAKDLQNVVASLSDGYGSFEDSFQKRVAESTDENIVTVKYVGNGSEEGGTEQFNIHVNQLAKPQVNQGQFLNDISLSFIPGSYSFDLDTLNSSYELQFNINNGDTNKDVLNKISNLVNNSNLGINAELVSDGHAASALRLTSKQTGLGENEDYLFSIAPSGYAGSVAAMDILRINNVLSPASNSEFSLNGVTRSSLSNTFTINNTFELSLNSVNEEDSYTTIGFKANIDAIADNIQTLLDSYNSIVTMARNYSGTEASAGNKFQNEISSVVYSQKSSLEYIGLMMGEDGTLTIDKDILAGAISPDREQNTFETINSFKASLGEKADSIAIDPMNYVNKVVVAYKNPGHNFNTPYISSIYSGLMLDDYA